MAKIILIDPIGNETKVATFKTTIEAMQAASLFNAIMPQDTEYQYIVEHRYKGTNRRTHPDNLRITVNHLTHLYNHLYK